MKKLMIYMVLLLMPTMTFAEDILGRWMTDAKNGIVEFYQKGDVVNGKIVWLEQAYMPDEVTPTQDIMNPDKKLKDRPLLGADIIWDMKFNGKIYDSGKVYDPEHGKTYKCTMFIEDGILKVQGHLGPFHKTLKWTRIEEK